MRKKSLKKPLSAECKKVNVKKTKLKEPIYDFDELLLCNNVDKFVKCCKKNTINQIDTLAYSTVNYQIS